MDRRFPFFHGSRPAGRLRLPPTLRALQTIAGRSSRALPAAPAKPLANRLAVFHNRLTFRPPQRSDLGGHISRRFASSAGSGPTSRWRIFGSRWRPHNGQAMPSLMRFLFVLALIAGGIYGGMVALVNYVEPRPREMSVRIPPGKLDFQN
jgi:hypothetical protein